jgi:hypothetical protein
MGNDVIFEFVVHHTSRMAPSGAVLEAYMTLTATRRVFTFQMIETVSVEATVALGGGSSAFSR